MRFESGTGIGILLEEAWVALRANRGRSLLTVLGIVIGVAAVIIMMNLGHSASKRIENEMSAMGSNLLMIMPGATGGGVRGAGGSVNTLKWDDCRAIATLPGVAAAVPEVSSGVTATWSGQAWTTSMDGTTPEKQGIAKLKISSGRFFDDDDIRGIANVAVLGSTAASSLFPAGMDPVGQSIRLNGLGFRVIGVLMPTGASMGRDNDDIVYIPLSTAQIRLLGSDSVQLINVEAATTADLQTLPEVITTLLRERHRLASFADNDFTIRNMQAILDTVQNTAGIMTALLAGVAAVSLLVGGIGIMNIMLVSITERTREIGIRMSVGATESAIMLQFLAESGVLSLTGGVIGIILGIATSTVLSLIIKWPLVVSLSAVLISVFFAILVGVFFGYYPARRAAALDPVEALRHQ